MPWVVHLGSCFDIHPVWARSPQSFGTLLLPKEWLILYYLFINIYLTDRLTRAFFRSKTWKCHYNKIEVESYISSTIMWKINPKWTRKGKHDTKLNHSAQIRAWWLRFFNMIAFTAHYRSYWTCWQGATWASLSYLGWHQCPQ